MKHPPSGLLTLRSGIDPRQDIKARRAARHRRARHALMRWAAVLVPIAVVAAYVSLMAAWA